MSEGTYGMSYEETSVCSMVDDCTFVYLRLWWKLVEHFGFISLKKWETITPMRRLDSQNYIIKTHTCIS